MADANSSSSSKPDGRIVDSSHADHEEDGPEAGVMRANGVDANFYSPQYWGQTEDVLTRRCDQCGEVGNLACFSPSFRRWLLKRYAEKEQNHRCCRCSEMGHNCLSCPLPITFKWPQVSTSTDPQRNNRIMNLLNPAHARPIKRRKAPRCSRCGKLGHNCRSCRRPSHEYLQS